MKENVMIFGDSYSTFEGYIPEGYEIYYFKTERPETDVTRVTETWWHQVIEQTGWNLVRNDSWSGSTICYTGYDGEDLSHSASFIYRLRTLKKEGFFRDHEIHRVLVFGGTNDSWCEAPLGKVMENPQEADLYSVLPALCLFFQELRETLPHAKIHVLINTELKPEITDTMESLCGFYGMETVHFDYIHKRSDHPTIEGMKDISRCVLKALEE
ncbi:MAG: hypothetical protein IKM59_01675 [Oscillospiraceae bacterium]|nr:hypothetical protein [Oscillospiraceae bacterium]